MILVKHLPLFLIAFSSLLPLINPIGTALIIDPFFKSHTVAQRKGFSLRIVFYCLALGLFFLLLGNWCLRFMGITVSTTQIAGGIIIARMGISFLTADQKNKDDQPSSPNEVEESLFYPIAFPLTLGPGGISVLIALAAHAHTPDLETTLINIWVIALALLAVLIITYFCFAYSSLVIKRMGPSGSLVLQRLMAFLVFCIGIQMTINGLSSTFPHLFEK